LFLIAGGLTLVFGVMRIVNEIYIADPSRQCSQRLPDVYLALRAVN
jgi:hypothetical protein